MKPYFETKLGKLYCGDCLEVMKDMSDKSVDLVLTDPPYGIGADEAAAKNEGKWGWKDYGMTKWDKERPKKEYFEEIFRVSKNQIIWGGNYFTDYLYPSMGWLFWNKGQRNFSLADGELAWTSFDKALRAFDYSRALAMKDVKRHPTQKAMALMKWCLALRSVEGEEIIDPYIGSGTTAVACERLGRKWIGIEISEKYCEIAARRIDSEAKQGKLF